MDQLITGLNATAITATTRVVMSKTAYLLIETEPGQAFNVVRGLGILPEVTEADFVSGPYDVIAHVKVKDVTDIGRLITKRVHPLPGVVRTLTCISIK